MGSVLKKKDIILLDIWSSKLWNLGGPKQNLSDLNMFVIKNFYKFCWTSGPVSVDICWSLSNFSGQGLEDGHYFENWDASDKEDVICITLFKIDKSIFTQSAPNRVATQHRHIER